jgi:hypothetical protein
MADLKDFDWSKVNVAEVLENQRKLCEKIIRDQTTPPFCDFCGMSGAAIPFTAPKKLKVGVFVLRLFVFCSILRH